MLVIPIYLRRPSKELAVSKNIMGYGHDTLSILKCILAAKRVFGWPVRHMHGHMHIHAHIHMRANIHMCVLMHTCAHAGAREGGREGGAQRERGVPSDILLGSAKLF
jgi:hypothetical protein